MKVKDLKEFLSKFDDDLEVIETRHSDYSPMQLSSWSLVKGVDNGHWVMRSHPTMSDENKALEKTYLHFAGN